MRWLLVSTAVIVAMLGCRNNAQLDAHLELMNAERRALEDELYELEYDYEVTAKKLEETRRENEKLRSQADESSGDFLDLSPNREEDEAHEIPDLELSPPTIEPGVPSAQATETESSQPRSVLESSRRNPVAIRQPFETARSTSGSVSHIYIDPVLTKVRDFDSRPGHDGITVVIEPRDDTGAFVPQAGAVSVVLLDYSNRGRGHAARVARWELDINQTSQMLYDSEDRRGIHLQLEWPSQPPANGRLRMDVRFTTEDGTQLETRQDIAVAVGPGSLIESDIPQPAAAPDAQAARGWTPRSAERPRDHGSVAGRPIATPQPGRPWSLEQAAGDAIRHDRSTPTAGQHRIARPEWKPYR